jgi:uncharacterized protein YecT (DUF1311 family)
MGVIFMKRIVIYGILIAAISLSGCGKSDEIKTENGADAKETIVIEVEKKDEDVVKEKKTVESDGIVAATEGSEDIPDSFKDYQSEIDADVNAAVASASSLQDEISKIQEIVTGYSELSDKAETQTEMNMSSQWSYVIWDKELNSLWSRISDSADEQTKEKLLSEQRNWISMKEEVKLENIGRMEDGGSMYPMNENAFLSEITFNRSCILANELAKIKGETFEMPPRSVYGTYVDNQGTGEVYSSLITKIGMELDNEAIISIFRLGGTEGTFSDGGNGVLEFTSYSENVKGIIRINGWEGATFEVTECFDCPFTVGDKYEFNFAF